MNSVLAHKTTYSKVIAAVSNGDADLLDALLSPDLIDYNPLPNQPPGIRGFKQWMSAVRSSFPDLRGTVERIVAEGELVAGEVTWRGTQHGDFLGFPPTGKHVEFKAFHIVRFAAGKIVEWRGTADILGAAQQLGAMITTPRM